MAEFDGGCATTQEFIDFYDLTDGRKHLIEVYNSNCYMLNTFSVVENEIPYCLKQRDDCGWESFVGHLGVFETDEQAAKIINDHIENSLKVTFEIDFDELTFCYDNVSKSIAKLVNSEEITFYTNLNGELMHDNVFRISRDMNSEAIYQKSVEKFEQYKASLN